MTFICTLPFSEPAELFRRLTVRYVNYILYKYHYANLGPLLQTCKCRVQSSSTVIYAPTDNIFEYYVDCVWLITVPSSSRFIRDCKKIIVLLLNYKIL